MGYLPRLDKFVIGLAGLALSLACFACGGSGLGKEVRTDVSKRMNTARDPIAACYEQALQRNRKLQGRMVLEFTAAPDTGKFTNVKVVRNDLRDTELTECVVSEVGELALAKPQKTAVSVTYPLQFSPLD